MAERWFSWSERIRFDGDPSALFTLLYGDSPVAVWLDSAQPAYGMGRFSFMGAPDGPRDHLLSFNAAARRVEVDGHAAGDDVWAAIADRIDAHVVEPIGDLPFAGGYVGVVGYETRSLTDRGDALAAPSASPDVQLAHLSRFVAIDHASSRLHVVAVGPPEDEAGSRSWIAETLARTAAAPPRATDAPSPEAPVSSPSGSAPMAAAPGTVAQDAPGTAGRAAVAAMRTATASVSRERYLADLGTVREWLERGDSYEACYTYALRFAHPEPGLAAYRRLRTANPAPYAAYLRLPGREVLSCSPERFLATGVDGRAEAKPIKGTARRLADPASDATTAASLAADPKTLAENLMIVDLIRNDLGRISAPGSVTVPLLSSVESYATVHQLVSTIRSTLLPRPAAGVRAAEALFPPGSMTGAPKKRTVELLDGLEAAPRGVYSGVAGYFSRSGSVDLSVVIRTAVIENGEATVGTGGAITIDSDPEAELDETIAKSSAVLGAFGVAHPFAS